MYERLDNPKLLKKIKYNTNKLPYLIGTIHILLTHCTSDISYRITVDKQKYIHVYKDSANSSKIQTNSEYLPHSVQKPNINIT